MWTKNIKTSSKKGSSWGLDCVVLKAAVLATQAESEEAKAAAKDFGDADVDGDGALSTEEFLKAAGEKGIPEADGEALFKALDTSGNGKVERAEFVAGGGFSKRVDVPDIPNKEVPPRLSAKGSRRGITQDL